MLQKYQLDNSPILDQPLPNSNGPYCKKMTTKKKKWVDPNKDKEESIAVVQAVVVEDDAVVKVAALDVPAYVPFPKSCV